MTNPLFDNNAPDPADVDVETAKAALIGEGRKYKTADDGIKALYHSQAHIARLEREMAEAKAALAERKNGEDLLALLEQKLKTPNNQGTPPEPKVEEVKNIDTLTKAEIAALLDERLNVSKKLSIEEQNLNSVVKTLEENWGPSFKQDLKAKATAMGVSEDYLLTLAKQSPQVFISAVGGNVKRGSPTDSLPPRTSQRGVPANDNQPGVRNKAYYDKMRRENSKQYFSAATQVQMHNDAITLKEKFFA